MSLLQELLSLRENRFKKDPLLVIGYDGYEPVGENEYAEPFDVRMIVGEGEDDSYDDEFGHVALPSTPELQGLENEHDIVICDIDTDEEIRRIKAGTNLISELPGWTEKNTAYFEKRVPAAEAIEYSGDR